MVGCANPAFSDLAVLERTQKLFPASGLRAICDADSPKISADPSSAHLVARIWTTQTPLPAGSVNQAMEWPSPW